MNNFHWILRQQFEHWRQELCRGGKKPQWSSTQTSNSNKEINISHRHRLWSCSITITYRTTDIKLKIVEPWTDISQDRLSFVLLGVELTLELEDISYDIIVSDNEEWESKLDETGPNRVWRSLERDVKTDILTKLPTKITVTHPINYRQIRMQIF